MLTQKAAICHALLQGEVLSIMTAFKQFYCTNLPREISRSIEKEFGVQVSRTKRTSKSTYGEPGFYYQYRLNRDAKYNQAGIVKIREYVFKNFGNKRDKTNPLNQAELFS